MILFLFIFTFLFSSLSFTGEHHVPSHADDHGPDLPQIGSSLFDKIFSKENAQGQIIYNVPFPIEKLTLSLGPKNELVHTILPFSRSLQRPQDLSYDPILNPRIVFTPRRGSHLLTPKKLFFGYVEARDQIEVISFNDEAGRFEYQIVKNYSQDPKVFYVNRGKCLSCHQNQAPIFSFPTWADTSNGVMGTIFDKKLELRNLTRTQFTDSIFGKSKSQEFLFIFDGLVRDADRLNLDERAWVHGCGKDNRCRLGLLLNTLCRSCSNVTPDISYAAEVLKSSLLNQQNKYNSFLSSFNLDAPQAILQYESLEKAVESPDFSSQMITNLYNLSAINNPATKRPLDIDIDEFFAPLKSFINIDYSILQSEFPQNDDLKKLLYKLYKEDHFIFQQDALNRVEIMATLLRKVGSSKSKDYEKWIGRATPKKQLFSGHFQPVFGEATLNVFSRHCHQCHAVGLPFPPQFLLGTEEEVTGKIHEMREAILTKLEGNLMPPNKKAREDLKSSGDYDRLIEYLNRE